MKSLVGRSAIAFQPAQRPRGLRDAFAAAASPPCHRRPVTRASPAAPARPSPGQRPRPSGATPSAVTAQAPVLAPTLAAAAAAASAVGRDPWSLVGFRIALDMAVPIMELWIAFKLLDWLATRLKKGIDARMAGDGSLMDELGNRATLVGLLLLSLRKPASYMLPPLVFIYLASPW
ncbi:hypothetical protein MNEG_1531 [Monoraphidium neglectum]|uniref:Uncharacterized protein n=1 Tax=Monoraphidium neglectum TaxID=145388 RepID=A0A0D2LIX6_9CHLO|nr:hypothetical protein MNEG_1531 [Monoraphidium neglectum]KIZ06414.1 hypothetical protein MNEG_1531 [Monoraphidium neglectum]|eukprot:XP_013905433.1 hypothetical protein MNEG_1531 [Monoraphidium neglectum]